MNALWITRMSEYRTSINCIDSARNIIAIKISRQNILLKKYDRAYVDKNITKKNSLNDIFLEEARVAKKFWREFGSLTPQWLNFQTRKPRSGDITNTLLDIGYHHVCGVISSILERHSISPALGLLHIARTSKSKPLVYDLVEMFRSDIVDSEILRFLRLKKKEIVSIEKEVGHFLHNINMRLERKYYLKNFKTCHTYRYYMELQILSFISAINHKRAFNPIHLPARHEHRC